MKYLIVDDHALVAGALTLLLEDRDPEADVHTAATADAALELVDREGDADLLILDLSLPGVTGTELMEEIVRRQPMLKILVVSGLADQESIMRVLQLLAQLAKGAPIKRICRELDLSEGTVKTHVAAIYRSFGASNRTEALIAARRAGFDIDL